LLPWVEDWGGRAAVDSVGYRLVQTFRLEARARALEPLLAVALPGEPYFDYDGLRQHEGPLWQLVTRQPPHLLDPRYADWPALLLDAADATLAAATADGDRWRPGPGASTTDPASSILSARFCLG
jgi:penicillin G amidase